MLHHGASPTCETSQPASSQPAFSQDATRSCSGTSPGGAGGQLSGSGSLFTPGHLRTIDGKIWVVLLVAAFSLPARLGYGAWRRYRIRRLLRRRRDRALALAFAAIASQRGRLQARRLQLVDPARNGTADTEQWTREKSSFCRSRILRSLTAQGLQDQWDLIALKVDHQIEKTASSTANGRRRQPVAGNPQHFDPEMDPLDYERHCALLLRKAGWDATITSAGADQGTDVLARRGKRSLVLQCKLYSKPVGNSAVQQIAAARAHHRADFAAVVSNADFTRQARELAATNDVYLLHHDELRDFPPRQGFGRSAMPLPSQEAVERSSRRDRT